MVYPPRSYCGHGFVKKMVFNQKLAKKNRAMEWEKKFAQIHNCNLLIHNIWVFIADGKCTFCSVFFSLPSHELQICEINQMVFYVK